MKIKFVRKVRILMTEDDAEVIGTALAYLGTHGTTDDARKAEILHRQFMTFLNQQR
jgi:hypothetical protein